MLKRRGVDSEEKSRFVVFIVLEEADTHPAKS